MRIVLDIYGELLLKVREGFFKINANANVNANAKRECTKLCVWGWGKPCPPQSLVNSVSSLIFSSSLALTLATDAGDSGQ